MRKLLAAIAAVLVLSEAAHAITWARKSIDDPFAPGAKCQVSEPMSSGSYIYSYPEKWDGVYWPHTDPSWIWRCDTSGYVAFGDEFDDLDEDQKVAVGLWLKENGEAAPGVEGSLARIEELEQFRNREPAEAAWFKRLMAQWRTESDSARADKYRQESIPLMMAALETAKPEDKIQLHFLLGVYAEKFESVAAADAWFAMAREGVWTDQDGKESTGIPYFNEMIDELIARRSQPVVPG
jgi:hypothetical protein